MHKVNSVSQISQKIIFWTSQITRDVLIDAFEFALSFTMLNNDSAVCTSLLMWTNGADSVSSSSSICLFSASAFATLANESGSVHTQCDIPTDTLAQHALLLERWLLSYFARRCFAQLSERAKKTIYLLEEKLTYQ